MNPPREPRFVKDEIRIVFRPFYTFDAGPEKDNSVNITYFLCDRCVEHAVNMPTREDKRLSVEPGALRLTRRSWLWVYCVFPGDQAGCFSRVQAS